MLHINSTQQHSKCISRKRSAFLAKTNYLRFKIQSYLSVHKLAAIALGGFRQSLI